MVAIGSEMPCRKRHHTTRGLSLIWKDYMLAGHLQDKRSRFRKAKELTIWGTAENKNPYSQPYRVQPLSPKTLRVFIIRDIMRYHAIYVLCCGLEDGLLTRLQAILRSKVTWLDPRTALCFPRQFQQPVGMSTMLLVSFPVVMVVPFFHGLQPATRLTLD